MNENILKRNQHQKSKHRSTNNISKQQQQQQQPHAISQMKLILILQLS